MNPEELVSSPHCTRALHIAATHQSHCCSCTNSAAKNAAQHPLLQPRLLGCCSHFN